MGPTAAFVAVGLHMCSEAGDPVRVCGLGTRGFSKGVPGSVEVLEQARGGNIHCVSWVSAYEAGGNYDGYFSAPLVPYQGGAMCILEIACFTSFDMVRNSKNEEFFSQS